MPSTASQTEANWPPLDFYVARVESTAKLGPATSVHIENRWGDIRLRSEGASGSILIDAAVQRIGDPFPKKPELYVTETTDHFELAVQYPDATIDPRSGRVDLAVYVPDGFKVSAETLDGTIEAKKTAVDLIARTTSGAVTLINQGSANVETRSGNIVARPIAPGWGTLELYSTEGKITAFLPVGPGLEVIARGTTDIRSDWPLVPDDQHHLLTFGSSEGMRDEALITSGRAIELLEVVLPPARSELKIRP